MPKKNNYFLPICCSQYLQGLLLFHHIEKKSCLWQPYFSFPPFLTPPCHDQNSSPCFHPYPVSFVPLPLPPLSRVPSQPPKTAPTPPSPPPPALSLPSHHHHHHRHQHQPSRPSPSTAAAPPPPRPPWRCSRTVRRTRSALGWCGGPR